MSDEASESKQGGSHRMQHAFTQCEWQSASTSDVAHAQSWSCGNIRLSESEPGSGQLVYGVDFLTQSAHQMQGQSRKELQVKHRPAILKKTTQSRKGSRLRCSSHRSAFDDGDDNNQTSYTTRSVQMKRSPHQKRLKKALNSMLHGDGALTENCKVLTSVSGMLSKPFSGNSVDPKTTKTRVSAKQPRKIDTSVVSFSHLEPLCALSSADKASPRHSCGCSRDRCGEASPGRGSCLQSPLSKPERDQHDLLASSVLSINRLERQKCVSRNISKKIVDESSKNTSKIVTSCFGESKCAKSTVVATVNKEKRQRKSSGDKSDTECLTSASVVRNKGREGDELAPCTKSNIQPAVPKKGISVLPTATTVGSSSSNLSQRSPFGFFHNDKLFVFVPPSPEKGESPEKGKSSGVIERVNKRKASTCPLNLQSDQLMGTSRTLVQRIRKSSDNIPVVIVRQKKKTVDNFVRDESTSGMAPSVTRAINTLDDADPTTSAALNKGVNLTKEDPTIMLRRVCSADKDESTVKNIELKDCYIDMGKRESLPQSVQLGNKLRSILVCPGKSESVASKGASSDSSHQISNEMKEKREENMISSNPFDTSASTHQKKMGGKPSFVIANTDAQALPCLNSDRTSLLAELLLLENQGLEKKREPVTVLLQTEESKTLLVMPTGSVMSLNKPIKLLKKELPRKSKSVELEETKASLKNKNVKPDTSHITTTKAVDKTLPIQNKAKTPRTEINISKVDTNAQNQNKNMTEIQEEGEGRSTQQFPGPVKKTRTGKSEKRNRVRQPTSVAVKKVTKVSSGGQIKSNHSVVPLMSKSKRLKSLELRPVSLRSESNMTHVQRNSPVELFKGITQLLYAAGAQISTNNGLTTSRRAVFTLCFTSRDTFLTPQEGVPGNLPAFLSFNKDHMISMIFTSHLCSGFFLVQPTGLVKEDPSKPDMYVESAYLMPYSHRLHFPQDALSLVIGPLEEDWRVSLRTANSLPQKSSPKDVVRHFIGLEECRCFSGALVDLDKYARVERRALSAPDYVRHRRNLEVIGCRCRDCGAYARSRRGNKKLSEPGSEDESLIQLTPQKLNHSDSQDTLKSTVDMCSHCGEDEAGTHQEQKSIQPKKSIECNNSHVVNCAENKHRLSLSSIRQMTDASLCGCSDMSNEAYLHEQLPRKRKCEKLIVKMGFPFKKCGQNGS